MKCITIGYRFDSHPRVDSVLQNTTSHYRLLENAISAQAVGLVSTIDATQAPSIRLACMVLQLYRCLFVCVGLAGTLTAGCLRPSIEIVLPPGDERVATRFSTCVIECEECLEKREYTLDACRSANRDAELEGAEMLLLGPYGIACADEHKALLQCRDTRDECFRRHGIDLKPISKEHPPTKPADFDSVDTVGYHLVLFSKGVVIPLQASDDTTLTFARPVRGVSSTYPASIRGNRVVLQSSLDTTANPNTDLVVSLDDGTQCHFTLQPGFVGSFETRGFTFDCLPNKSQLLSTTGVTSAPPVVAPPTFPPIIGYPQAGDGYKDTSAKGYYTTRFEVSAFRSCGSSAVWFLRSKDREIATTLQELIKRSSCKDPTCSYPLFIKGALSPLGSYGHMGAYPREIVVYEVTQPPGPENARLCD